MKKNRLLSNMIKITVSSFLISFVLVFGLNHFGKISFLYDYKAPPRSDGKIDMVEYVPNNTKISIFYFETFFKNKVQINGGKWTLADISYETEFQNYSNKSNFYLKGTLADKKYIVWISLVITFLLLIIIYFNEIKRFTIDAKNYPNRTHLGYSGVIIILIMLFITTYLDKQHYIDYNNDLTEQIQELNNRISDLEDENEELNDKVTSNEYDLKKSEINRDYYETLHNMTSNYDDFYVLTKTVPYDLIVNTEYAKYIKNSNSLNAELEIRGKDNVIDFLNYISKQYYFMYLSK